MSALPEYSSPAQQDFAFAYAEAVAAHDEMLPGILRPSEMHATSAKIARICDALVAGAHSRQIKSLWRDLPKPSAEVDYPKELPPAQVALRAATKLIFERNSRRPIAEMQSAIHKWAVTNAVNVDNKLRFRGEARMGQVNDLLGKRTEMLTVGLLSRPAMPGVLALPALPHHEAALQAKTLNYDLVLLETETAGPEVAAHRVQVKTTCLGLSYLHETPFVEPSWYEPGIAVVSGCCEIVDGDETSYGAITQTLRREMLGKASQRDIDRLDILSESVITAIADGQTGYAIRQRVLENI